MEIPKALREHRQQLQRLAEPCYAIATKPGAPAGPSASRFGGLPALPPDQPWPSGGKTERALRGLLRRSTSFPLPFLGQLNLGELPPGKDRAQLRALLPEKGLLAFFYDCESCGDDPAHAGSHRVLHLEEPEQCRNAEPPEELLSFPAAALGFAEAVSFPGLADPRLDLDDFSEEDLEAYDEFLVERHQLLGHCLAAAEDPRAIAATAAGRGGDWRLLLQLKSDEALDWNFGDDGVLSFLIPEERLLAGDFSATWVVVQ